jgi:hypothetical protein
VWKFCTSAKSLKRGQLEDLLATAVWKFAAANCWRKRERERSRRICNICQPRIRRTREKIGLWISSHASTTLGPAFAFLLILFKMI